MSEVIRIGYFEVTPAKGPGYVVRKRCTPKNGGKPYTRNISSHRTKEDAVVSAHQLQEKTHSNAKEQLVDKRMTQNGKVLAYLKRNGTITIGESLGMYIPHLPRRIMDLMERGHRIRREQRYRTRGGSLVTRYHYLGGPS